MSRKPKKAEIGNDAAAVPPVARVEEPPSVAPPESETPDTLPPPVEEPRKAAQETPPPKKTEVAPGWYVRWNDSVVAGPFPYELAAIREAVKLRAAFPDGTLHVLQASDL